MRAADVRHAWIREGVANRRRGFVALGKVHSQISGDLAVDAGRDASGWEWLT